MADLETIAIETVAKLTKFLGEVDQVHTNITELQEELTQVGEQVDTSWNELSDRALSLIDHTTTAADELTAEVEEIYQSIG